MKSYTMPDFCIKTHIVDEYHVEGDIIKYLFIGSMLPAQANDVAVQAATKTIHCDFKQNKAIDLERLARVMWGSRIQVLWAKIQPSGAEHKQQPEDDRADTEQLYDISERMFQQYFYSLSKQVASWPGGQDFENIPNFDTRHVNCNYDLPCGFSYRINARQWFLRKSVVSEPRQEGVASIPVALLTGCYAGEIRSQDMQWLVHVSAVSLAELPNLDKVEAVDTRERLRYSPVQSFVIERCVESAGKRRTFYEMSIEKHIDFVFCECLNQSAKQHRLNEISKGILPTQNEKNKGRPQKYSSKHDQEIAEKWKGAKAQGISKTKFSSDHGLSVSDFDALLDREYQRRKSATSGFK